MPAPSSAKKITKNAKSNLAFALACLPPQIRSDMSVFYAFCRVVDDVVDESDRSLEEKRRELSRWSQVVGGEVAPDAENGLEGALAEVLERNSVDRDMMREIVNGMAMDLTVRRYESLSDLEGYCYRAAGAVGLVSVRIFGCETPESEVYAVELGHALQLTNIIRDVGEDLLEHDRIYLPQVEMERFGVDEEVLREGRHTPEFRSLMGHMANLAEQRYFNASEALPSEERHKLRASELMRAIYHALLQKMARGDFRVLERRFRLSRLQKLMLLSRSVMLGTR